MSKPSHVQAFSDDLWKVINRYRAEFDLTVAEAIGTLEVTKLELFVQETIEEESEE